MTDTGAKKYLFDNDFSLDGGIPAPVQNSKSTEKVDEKAAPADAAEATEAAEAEVEAVEEAPAPPTYSEEDLAQAREEGLQAGRDEATRDMASALEQRLANTLDAVNAQVSTLFDTYTKDKDDLSRNAVGVAAAIVHKLFPALNMEKAMGEIEHMIVEAMKRTGGAPALIIRVPKELHQEVEVRAQELAALRGREGSLNVIADADMPIGDVTVEWGGGGMTRDTSFIWQEIDAIIERNLGQKLDTYAPGPETTPESEQSVVNPAKVGKDEESPAESPQIDGDTPESHVRQELDAESDN